jgi:hypothetical protein
MAILKHFGPFAAEGAIVGRLLTGYSNLEVNLLNCVQVANGDFDTALKTMFGKRGETKRIDRALKLVEDRYAALGLGKEFARAIDAMQYCLAIRNQFSHWVWWDDGQARVRERRNHRQTEEESSSLGRAEASAHRCRSPDGPRAILRLRGYLPCMGQLRGPKTRREARQESC